MSSSDEETHRDVRCRRGIGGDHGGVLDGRDGREPARRRERRHSGTTTAMVKPRYLIDVGLRNSSVATKTR
jgi:hypothetical protein